MTAPPPPRDLASRSPLIEVLPAGTKLHRFYSSAYTPVFFDQSKMGRLNAPDGSYGVLYAAKNVQGAFAETFLRNPGTNAIAADFLKKKAYVELVTTEELRFIRLAGPGLAKLGATAEVVHAGLPYDVPQAWSAALHALPLTASGIAYHARHDDVELCYALFDRERAKIKEQHRIVDLDDDWFWQVADGYDVGLAP